MRLPFFAVLFLCTAFLCVILSAAAYSQIPENARFQPGSYAFGPYVPPLHFAPQPLPESDDEESEADDEESTADFGSGEADNAEETSKTEWSKTDWEKKFAPILNAAQGNAAKSNVSNNAAVQTPPGVYQQVPYLQFSYDKWNRRFHLVPYEPGYAMRPAEFPARTSPLYVFISSLSSEAIPQPPVRYMSYYDPAPIVLPAEIRLRGTRFFERDMQPMPLPVPKPANAVLVSPPPRTQLGRTIQNTFGDFKLQ
ncbi:MAG: hypothetical protein LBT46_14155 [Planctomycetaceae bacterium]|jgi:hypothetical protein|nr:hypothetical protein [Planctomycetaceae bacterium]